MPTRFKILYLCITSLVALSSCANPPSCTDERSVHATAAPSAGCITLLDGHLLLVQGLNGKVSVPGGSTNPGETAQCAAQRETWEETGLEVRADELVRTFDNGFHLYQCMVTTETSIDTAMTPPFRLEIRQALWLNPAQFDQFEWRFPDQQQWLADWIEAKTEGEL
jgi:8-oxo-dGTP diphosphatase